jgi:hypothetical protein
MQTSGLQPQGFRTCAKNIGIKDTTLDFTVIASDHLGQTKQLMMTALQRRRQAETSCSASTRGVCLASGNLIERRGAHARSGQWTT